jgi:hypothetical protein
MSGGRAAGNLPRVWGIGACLLAVLVGRPAFAQSDDREGGVPLGWSVGAGCGLALVSMAVGGGISAGFDDERSRKTGVEILAGGVALAPVVSHLIAGEWKRTAFFGGVSLSLALFTAYTVERTSAVLEGGSYVSRIPFGIAVASQVVFTTVGLIDSLMAGERARARSGVAVLPLVGKGALGLSVGGTL